MDNQNKQQPELNAVTKKVLVILGLAVALFVPLAMVESQISSRRDYESVAQMEVAKGWGENVTFGSPTVSTSEREAFPSSETDIAVDSKEKRRGVFKVPVYVATLKTTVTFTRPQVKKLEQRYLIVPVKPIRAIQNFKVKDLGTGQELKKSTSPMVSFAGYNLVVLPFGMVTAVMMVLGSMYPAFFQKIRGALTIALIAVIIVELVDMFFFHKNYEILDWIVVVIFCGYIGYDWARANAIPRTIDNAVDSAAALYMDIINLFLRILRIMGRKR